VSAARIAVSGRVVRGFVLRCGFAALLCACGAMPALAQDDHRWTGQITPYVWGSGLGGTLTPFTGAPTVRIDKSFSEVLEDSDGAFFLSAYARRGRLVLLGDYSYAASSKDGLIPPGLPAEGRLRQSSLTLAGGWRVFEDDRWRLDLLGGLRQWNIKAAVQVPLAGIARSPDLDFTDPLLALRANLTLAPDWNLVAYVDAGGFGVGSDSTWQWLATVNYLHGERWAFSAGLRQLSLDYRDGGTRLDATLAGPLLGVSWRF
jgi:hypothetical protein